MLRAGSALLRMADHPVGQEAEGLVEEVRRVEAGRFAKGTLEIVVERRPIRSDARNGRSPARRAVRRQAAQVGQPLLGDDHLHVVLGVIDVSHHRDDGEIRPSLAGDGVTKIDR